MGASGGASGGKNVCIVHGVSAHEVSARRQFMRLPLPPPLAGAGAKRER